MTPGPIVDDAAALERLYATLAGADGLALAAEENAMHAYRARVCLLQVALVSGEGEPTAYVIDALAFQGVKKSPLADLPRYVPPHARVVVHGGEYALAALRRDFAMDFGANPPIDTQQAAVLLGLPETGYRSLCRTLLEVALPAPASVDWRLRPLSPDLVEHALADVRHIPALWRILARRIAAADLEDELAIASGVVAATPTHANAPDPLRSRHLPGASGLPPEGKALLDALVRWRDAKARELDVPPGRLLANARILALAQRPERALADLDRIRFHSRLLWDDREALKRQVTIALEAGAPPSPSSRPATASAPRPAAPRPARSLRAAGPPSPIVRARTARLKAWRREEAARREVGLQAILPGAALEHLAWIGAADLEGLAAVPQLGSRRIERYGAALLALCNAP
ncbi:MAG: HRDC domain-containing protein [Deltaproteobacteria bacterium]|nr:HRDC domain-containing protein [Deltaproteobacteria bacterium]